VDNATLGTSVAQSQCSPGGLDIRHVDETDFVNIKATRQTATLSPLVASDTPKKEKNQ
jgi:hypothetical protein